MSLQKHVALFEQFQKEIESSLTEHEIEIVRKTLSNAKIDLTWRAWIHRYKKNVLLYLSQTPEQRERAPAWKEDKERIFIIVAALVLARQAIVFLLAAKRAQGIEKLDSRPAFCEAAEQSFELLEDLDVLWPFSGQDPWGGERDLADPLWSDLVYPYRR